MRAIVAWAPRHRSSFWERGLVLPYQARMESAVGFLLRGAEGLGTHVGCVGAFRRTSPLEPGWGWCLVPESHPGTCKWLPVGGCQRTTPLLAAALRHLSLLPTLLPLRWKKEVIYFWGAFAPDVRWRQQCLYHCVLCCRTGAPGLCLLTLPLLPPALPALHRWQPCSRRRDCVHLPQLLGAGPASPT